MKATLDRPTRGDAYDTACSAVVTAFGDTAHALDGCWAGTAYPAGPREAVRAEYRARCEEAQALLARQMRAAGFGLGSGPFPEWLDRVLRLLTKLGVPLSPADAADPDQMPRPSAEVRIRSLETLLNLLVPGTPDPGVSPTGSGGLEITWSSDDNQVMAGFEVGPDGEPTEAWGLSRGDEQPWAGTLDASRDEIRRALHTLASE